jgi:hypothetical protein
MKCAIVILSDPKPASEEALGRLFNGLATAYEYKKAGDEVTIVFQGTGARWIEYVTKDSHPAHLLFEAVKENIAGVSAECARVFGATTCAEAASLPLIADNSVPGTDGVASLRQLRENGFDVLTF